LKKSNIYIAPRTIEGIGISFLEAMAIGMVVVAYNNGTQFRTADDNLGGDVKSNSIQNNQFISKSSTQPVCDFSSNQNNLTTIGTFNNNY